MPISAEQKSKVRSKFATLNKDGDKTLSFDEMKKLLRKGNPNMTDAELKLLFDGVDKNHDGKVDFDEFLKFLFPDAVEEDKGVKGPERFFYDKSSYTGTHTKGGPDNSVSRAHI